MQVFEPNAQRLLAELDPDALVLDVGGWACPFNRAQWVLDAEPYETRGYYRTFGGPPSQGGDLEWFSNDTWVQRDVCARDPWPFSDKQFDFVICSHTLEDIRDPLWACSEIIRVGKAGYIEVPSRAFETTRGVERRNMAGLSHHRWLIDISGDEICFLPKYHMLHTDWRFTIPKAFLESRGEAAAVQWLWWKDTFQYREVTIHGVEAQERELEQFAQRTYPRSAATLKAGSAWRQLTGLAGRAWNRLLRSTSC